MWEGGATKAFVVGADGKAAARALSTGTRRGGRVAVLSGLGEGDRVVVDGAGFLHEGEAVALVPSPTLEASR